jgi:hypothetical protein
MSTDPTSPRSGQPTEEELRAAYEAELKQIRIEQVLLENVVTMVNLGMRRTGLAPGTEDERDQGQVRVAIEAVRALLPLVEQATPAQGKAVRDALSQLQLAFVRIGGQPASADAGGESAAENVSASPEAAGSQPGSGTGGAGADPGGPEAPKPGEPGPAQRSGRLWVPGQ